VAERIGDDRILATGVAPVVDNVFSEQLTN